jgi:hypothetical protein
MLKNIIEIENKTWIKKNLKEEKKIVLVNSILVLVLVFFFNFNFTHKRKERRETLLWLSCLGRYCNNPAFQAQNNSKFYFFRT